MKLKGLSEKDLIQTLKREFPSPGERIILGIGDDAAVIDTGGISQVATKDLLIENTHFLANLHPPELLARKSVNVNLSDVAAMGCRPLYILLGLALPPDSGSDWIEAFISGLKQAVDEYDVALVGGDITRAERITISITVFGEGRRVITRGGARPGDRLFVSGTLGDAALGLSLLRDNVRLGDDPLSDRCLRAFLDPIAQVKLGEALSRARVPSAMIDLSDGLSLDLENICRESKIGAEVFMEQLPLSDALLSLSADPVNMALEGGEDYQLLFTVPPGRIASLRELRAEYPLHEIGCMVSGEDIYRIDKEGKRELLEPSGFDHFQEGQT
jgi:thiamine-monophosphate kinase